jgi:putative phage-type endonuclease
MSRPKVGVTERPQSWHDERLAGIGGSEAAAAVGLSPWMDPIELWAIKRGEQAPADATLRMKIGNLVEPAIGALYSDVTGRKLRHHERQFVHPDHPFVRDHPDFSVVGERVLVQAKNAGPFAGEWGPPGKPDSIPTHYRIQGHHELLATGFERVDFAVLSGGDDFDIWPLERDDALLADLLTEEAEFWQHVLDGSLPRPSAGSKGALLRRFPKPDGVVKVASAEQEAVIREYLTARDRVTNAEKLRDQLEARVLAMIGDALGIEGAGARVSWGSVRGSVKWKEVAERFARDLNFADELRDKIAENYRGEPYRKVSVAKAGRTG